MHAAIWTGSFASQSGLKHVRIVFYVVGLETYYPYVFGELLDYELKRDARKA